jgi:hypothetical protein
MRALSRVLTEILFIVIAFSAAVAVYSTYRNYTTVNSAVNRLACSDAVLISAAKQVYITVKNIGTSNLNVTISSISESGIGKNLTLHQIEYAEVVPGKEQSIKASVDGLSVGSAYSITVVGKVGETVVTYQVIESTAMP